ncbi:MAG: type II toxin-antitoxin system RelE/ParE family toxin [Thermomicrobiales bacterium]
MSFSITFSQHFLREAKRFFRKHPDLREEYERVLEDLRIDPHQPRLRLHPLTGRLRGQHAISLTYAYRITLTLLVTEHTITLLDIGVHDEVYR